MKGFVCLFGSDAAWRFVANGAFDALEARHDVTYVALRWGELMERDGLAGLLAQGGRRVVWLPGYAHRTRQWAELFNISCITYQDRSPSFAVRAREQERQDPAGFNRLRQLAEPGRYEQHRGTAERRLGFHPELLSLVLKERPDFLVLPSKLQDGLTHDALQLADALRLPSLLLVSTWDNLSSKGLLFHRPTMVGCWGEQSRSHAVEVQGMAPERVCVVGAPHYGGLSQPAPVDRAAVRQALGVPAQGPVVLFAGSLRPFDETQLLQAIDEAVADGRVPPLHVLYRPHPWRGARAHETSFHDVRWRHVSMDPQLAEAYRRTKEQGSRFTADNFLFELEHLFALYQAADAVISPMSTVLLESFMAGRPTMAIAFGDGKHSWSPEKVAQMLHFKEFYEAPDLVVCRSADEWLPGLRRLLSQVGDAAVRERLREQSRFFVHQDDRTYGARVSDAVERMIGQAGPPAYGRVRLKAGPRFAVEDLFSPHAVKQALGRFAGAKSAVE